MRGVTCTILLLASSFTALARDDPFSVAAVLRHERAFDRPHDIELHGDVAIVPGKGGSLAMVNVTDPAAPRLFWHRHDRNALEEAETVLVTAGRLFLGTHDFHSIDLRNPRQPIFQGRVSDRRRITRINGMARRGNTILAASKHGWLDAFDVSDPAQPTLAGALNLRAEHQVGNPHDVDLFREFAVVTDPAGFDRRKNPGKLTLVRVFDEAGVRLPEAQWKLAGKIVTTDLGGANRVQVSGHHAYVGASTRAQGGRLVVIDVRDPTSPREVAIHPFAPDEKWGPNGLTIAGNVVFLAGGQTVEAIDISNPTKPSSLGAQSFPTILANAHPRYAGGGDSAHDLVYHDGHLYVTGQNDRCLLILRIESKKIRKLVR